MFTLLDCSHYHSGVLCFLLFESGQRSYPGTELINWSSHIPINTELIIIPFLVVPKKGFIRVDRKGLLWLRKPGANFKEVSNIILYTKSKPIFKINLLSSVRYGSHNSRSKSCIVVVAFISCLNYILKNENSKDIVLIIYICIYIQHGLYGRPYFTSVF